MRFSIISRFTLSLIIASFAWACNSSGGGSGSLQKTEGGIEYQILARGSEEDQKKKIAPGTFITFHRQVNIITGEKDSLLENTFETPERSYKNQRINDSIPKGNMLEALIQMSQGDSAIIRIPASTIKKEATDNIKQRIKQLEEQKKSQEGNTELDEKLKEQFMKQIDAQLGMLKEQLEKPLPDFIKDNSVIVHTFKILSVKTKEEVDKEQEEAVKKQEEAAAAQLEKDKKVIKEYAKKNKLDVKSTASGLHYYIEKEGSGNKPSAGDSVSVEYVGKLLDGKVFDTSRKEVAEEADILNPNRDYAPFVFVLGQGMVIPGWDEGIALLKEGSKAVFLIPSGIAYGERGAGKDIPPNSVLRFDVELVKVHK